MALDPELQPSLVNVTLDGGAGDDALSATIVNNSVFTSSFIPDTVRLIGGSGDDTMFQKLTIILHSLISIADGGAGTDSLISFVFTAGTTGHPSFVIKSVEQQSGFPF